jgi:hypothetical protein
LAIKGRYYFTVSYGVRYEIFFPQRERLNKIATRVRAMPACVSSRFYLCRN